MDLNEREPDGRGRLAYAGAAVWGFAEATIFFIVPDVLLSWLALRSPRRATWACGWALLGALVGGCVMYAWGARDLDSATAMLLRVPAVDEPMLDTVRSQFDERGAATVLLGPLGGRPYKIYAAYAPAAGVSLPMLLAVSVPARLSRFLLVTWVTAAMAHIVLRRMKLRHKQWLLLACWVAFYAWFLS